VKIIRIGRNGAEHAAEPGDDPLTEPLTFGRFEPKRSLKDGDFVEVEAEGIGVVSSPVVAE